LVASKDAERQKVNFVVAVSKELSENYKAGDIVKKVASAIGGSGGGRPDFAQGGINDASKLSQLFEEFKKFLDKEVFLCKVIQWVV
jgi:Alanyl-tRNA synthetase